MVFKGGGLLLLLPLKLRVLLRRSCNKFIEQIKKDARVESYKALKEMVSDRDEWRREVVYQPSN